MTAASKAFQPNRFLKWNAWLLFFFALSFTFFAIQSGDVLMYLTLARDFLVHGEWPTVDPYLYSLPNAQLHIAHEYLSYFIFYGAWLAPVSYTHLTLPTIY